VVAFGREPVGPFDSDNLVKDFIDEAHAAGLKVVAYYWHMSEATIAGLHWEWVCKNLDGVTPISGPQRSGYLLDITGPYGEIVLTRLCESQRWAPTAVGVKNSDHPCDLRLRPIWPPAQIGANRLP
jgi:hypothetical protein